VTPMKATLFALVVLLAAAAAPIVYFSPAAADDCNPDMGNCQVAHGAP
jgi:hypothetical protein